MEKLSLYPHQQPHYEKVKSILRYNPYYVDTSVTGSGKTLVALKIAQEEKLKLIIIGPSASLSHWKNHLTTYDIKLYNNKSIFTYETLRSMKNKQPSHGYLERDDSDGKARFKVTSEYMNAVKKGVLLIFDEAHNLKNKGQTRTAAHSLINVITSDNTRSRIAFLSGTFTDKIETAYGFLRMVGVIRSPRLYSGKNGIYTLHGVQEMIDTGFTIAPTLTRKFLDTVTFVAKTKESKKYVFQFFCNVFVPTVFSHMKNVLDKNVTKDEKNGFYHLDDSKKYQEAILSLVQIQEEDGFNLTQALRNLELIKAPIMVRKSREHLTITGPTFPKVILFVNYHKVVEYLSDELKDYSPLILTGKAEDKKHFDDRVRLFQDDTPEHRLLICTVRTGGVSLNLQDLNGEFPRYVYLMPNYFTLATMQASGRTYRQGTKSTTIIRHIYGVGGELEQKILTALAKKSTITKSIMYKQSREGLKFPSDYENEVEKY